MLSENQTTNDYYDCSMFTLRLNKETAPIYLMGAVALISMVAGHSHPLDDSWWETWFSDLVAFIYTYHTQLYFFLGGFFLLKYSEKIDASGYRRWCFDRLRIFLIPYFSVSVISYLPKVILMNDNTGFPEMIRNLLLYPRDGVWGHFWFIPAFLFVDLLWGTWLAFGIKSKFVCEAVFICGGVISVVLAVFPIKNNIFLLTDISFHAVFYFIGMLFALFSIEKGINRKISISSIVVGCIVLLISYPYGNYRITSYPVINFLNGLLIIVILWSVSDLAAPGINKLLKYSSSISKYSFTIYLYSWPVQAVFDVILRRLGVNWLVIIIALFVAGFVIPLAMTYIYQKLQFIHCRFFDYLLGVRTTGD